MESTPTSRETLAQQIGWRLEEITSGGSGLSRELRSVATVLGALPIVFDENGTIAVRRDGTLLSYRWAEDHSLTSEIPARDRLIALVIGAEKYPELRELLPAKPADARPCPACSGTGLPLSDEELTIVRCSTCCGLGYVPTPLGGNASSS